jgi:pyruvate formate lyase activating enzyme
MTIDIRGFLETSMLDWDGKISSVIFLSGCNLRCAFCHNYPLVFEPEKLKQFFVKDIEKYLVDHKNWIDGVVISGGEPTIYKELEAFVRDVKNLGFPVKLDTNGTNPKMLKELVSKGLLDYIAMDVKGPLNSKYEKIAGCAVPLSDIKESIELIINSNVDHEFRTTVVPGLLDADDVPEIAKSIRGAKKFIIQQFEPPNAMDEGLRSVKPYPKEILVKMADASKVFVSNTIVRGV